MNFSTPVKRDLKYYVYLYSHPDTNEIFYVGEGKGDRVFSHMKDLGESKKVEYIKDLERQGLQPKIEILIHGVEDKLSVKRIESSVIDLIGINNLTNIRSGYKSTSHGRMSIEQVNAIYGKEKAEISEPSILFRINQAFRYSMNEIELYDYTRGQWGVNIHRAKKAQLAFSIYGGIVQEVYSILGWFKAGSTFSVRKDNKYIKRKANEKMEKRYEFIGDIAPPSIRKKYQYKSVNHYFKSGSRSSFMYLNVDKQ